MGYAEDARAAQDTALETFIENLLRAAVAQAEARVAELTAELAAANDNLEAKTLALQGALDTIAELEARIEELENPVDPEPEQIIAGSLPVGEARYEIPVGAKFVAKNGSNSNPGTEEQPWLTLAYAEANTPAGGAVVMREGIYSESMTIDRALTIQAYPSEAVWLDGSRVYDSWSGSGPWASPLAVSWPLIDSGRYTLHDPTSVLPEQVWIDGVAQKQIADGATPAAGQFSVSTRSGARTLLLGSNPAGKEVRVSEHRYAAVCVAPFRFLGLGIRRYSPSHVESGQNGMLYIAGDSYGSSMENCVLQESGMSALSTARSITLRNVTIQDCMNSGVQATKCTGFVLERSVIRRVNRGHWKMQPVVACVKITYADEITVRDNVFEDAPVASGLWLDTHCRRYTIVNNTVDGTSGMPGVDQMLVGILIEGADGGFFDGHQYRGIVANNRVRNCRSAFKSLLSGWHDYWNNEAQNSSLVNWYLQQDDRRNRADNQYGTIEESPFLMKDIGILNNVFGPAPRGMIAYHDPTANWDGGDVLLGWDAFSRIEGNWFQSTTGSMVELGKADGRRTAYNTLAALAASGPEVGDSTGKLGQNHQGTEAPDDSITVALPDVVAALLGVAGGTRKVGPILPAPEVSF